MPELHLDEDREIPNRIFSIERSEQGTRPTTPLSNGALRDIMEPKILDKEFETPSKHEGKDVAFTPTIHWDSETISQSEGVQLNEPINLVSELDTADEDSASRPGFELMDMFTAEITSLPAVDRLSELKRERMWNFLMLPYCLERVALLGWVICLEMFLHTFTILPIRTFKAILYIFKDSWKSVEKIRNRLKSLPRPMKNDILTFILLIISCMFLLNTNASKIYHSIRGQNALKLYVIFNSLELGDKLLTALGLDIMDCLLLGTKNKRKFKYEAIFWFFISIVYTVSHSVLLVYQTVTLNVAVNSHSNALLTLLMSTQFVEIKGAVFKRFEKENLFQMTCADIVERFQLSMMLLIIASRNLTDLPASHDHSNNGFIHLVSIMISSILMPMVLVMISEIVVDWIKHAFIIKFNHIRPSIYDRFTDILAQDSYRNMQCILENASFKKDSQNSKCDTTPLARRLGISLLPYACVFVNAMLQTYSMFASLTSRTITTLPTSSTTFDSSKILSTDVNIPIFLIPGLDSIITSQVFNLIYAFVLNSSILRFILKLFGFLILFLCTIYIKLSLSRWIYSLAQKRSSTMKKRELIENQNSKERQKIPTDHGAVEIDVQVREYLNNANDSLSGYEKKSLNTLERYSMVSKRIW